MKKRFKKNLRLTKEKKKSQFYHKTREDFILWNRENKEKGKEHLAPMTRTQSEFLDALVTIQDRMTNVGNVQRVFDHFYNFSKS